MLVAVNRPYKKSDYIPCIAWGRNARFSEKLEVGEHIKIWGRVQSREYQKKVNEDNSITKVAYEVSISKMEISEEENLEENQWKKSPLINYGLQFIKGDFLWIDRYHPLAKRIRCTFFAKGIKIDYNDAKKFKWEWDGWIIYWLGVLYFLLFWCLYNILSIGLLYF